MSNLLEITDETITIYKVFKGKPFTISGVEEIESRFPRVRLSFENLINIKHDGCWSYAVMLMDDDLKRVVEAVIKTNKAVKLSIEEEKGRPIYVRSSRSIR